MKIAKKVLSFLIELSIFCLIWMLIGTHVLDIKIHSCIIVFSHNYKLNFLVYGILVYIGSKLINLLICKIKRKSNVKSQS